MIPVITIEGATAVGKSNIAIELAKKLRTEIISADSRQVYRYLNIGTAKINAIQQNEVLHHLIDIIDPDQCYNAGEFCKDTMRISKYLNSKGKVPIICGGTGLYIKSLLEGLFKIPEIPPDIRASLLKRMETEGLNSLYIELESIDPDFASKISIYDKQRIQRGLEIYYATGMPISTHWKMQDKSNEYLPFRILIQDDRDVLYKRINQRVFNMIEDGLIKEITDLLKSGYTQDTIGLKTLGYKEFMPYIMNLYSLSECIDLTAQHTRNYAKRQLTWYRKCEFDLTISVRDFNISVVESHIERRFNN